VLNKEICKKCYLAYGQDWEVVYKGIWDEYNTVYCPKSITDFQQRMGDTKSEPPDHCPYVLEHTITKDESYYAEDAGRI
jgi:hypothetical protein